MTSWQCRHGVSAATLAACTAWAHIGHCVMLALCGSRLPTSFVAGSESSLSKTLAPRERWYFNGWSTALRSTVDSRPYSAEVRAHKAVSSAPIAAQEELLKSTSCRPSWPASRPHEQNIAAAVTMCETLTTHWALPFLPPHCRYYHDVRDADNALSPPLLAAPLQVLS